MNGWFKAVLAELGATSAALVTRHGIEVFVVLVVEAVIWSVLQFPVFARFRPLVEPVLAVTMVLIIWLLCTTVISLLTLGDWKAIRESHLRTGGGAGTWILLILILASVPGSFLVNRWIPGEISPSTVTVAKIASLQLPNSVRGGSAFKATLKWPRGATDLNFQFFVVVQRDFDYFSKLDNNGFEHLDFKEDGLFDQVVPRSSLTTGHHTLIIYKRRHGRSTPIEIETFQFETIDGN